MEQLNLLQRYARTDEGPHELVWEEAADALLALLAPLTPHLTAEIWSSGIPAGRRSISSRGPPSIPSSYARRR